MVPCPRILQEINLTLFFCVLWFLPTWGCRKHGQSPNQRLDDWKNILSYGPLESFPIWKFNRHFFDYSSDPLEISQGILNILAPLSSAPWNKLNCYKGCLWLRLCIRRCNQERIKYKENASILPLIGGENTGGRRRSPGPNWLERHNLSLFFSPTPQLMSINEFKVWGK